MRVWDRQPDESMAAYRAARLYFEAGPERTIAGVEAKLTEEEPTEGPESGPEVASGPARKPSSRLRSWSSKYRWVERAAAYDRHFDEVGDQARETVRANYATILEERRLKLAETEWLLSQALLARVTEMLRWPLSQTRTEEVSEDGKTIRTTIIEPVRWHLRDVAALVRIGVDLQRMSVGMPTRMAVQPIASSGSESTPVDQTQSDADNGRIPPELAEIFREQAARIALENAGLDDVQPDL